MDWKVFRTNIMFFPKLVFVVLLTGLIITGSLPSNAGRQIDRTLTCPTWWPVSGRAKHINASGIKTSRWNEFKNTHVYSVLKRYREREERIKTVREKKYEIEYGKFELKWLEDWSPSILPSSIISHLVPSSQHQTTPTHSDSLLSVP